MTKRRDNDLFLHSFDVKRFSENLTLFNVWENGHVDRKCKCKYYEKEIDDSFTDEQIGCIWDA